MYVADLAVPGAWVGGTVRSPIPCGELLGFDLDPAFDFGRVALARARDIPGDNVVALIQDDQPLLAEREIRHVGELLLLVAALDHATLEAALAAVRPRVAADETAGEEPLPALISSASVQGRSAHSGEPPREIEKIGKRRDAQPDFTPGELCGPPYGILSSCADGRRVGCEELTTARGRIRPRLHLFGHIHESYGTHRADGILSVNACNCDLGYRPVNPPVVLDWDGSELRVVSHDR